MSQFFLTNQKHTAQTKELDSQVNDSYESFHFCESKHTVQCDQSSQIPQ